MFTLKILPTILLTVLLSATTTMGEPASTGPADSSAPAAPAAVFDLDFPGGTPRDLAKALARASGQPVNVIIPIDGQSVQIPAFEVTAVSAAEVLLSIQSRSSNERVGYDFRRSNESSIWVMNIYRLRAESPTKSPQPVVKPVSVARFLERYSIDDLSTAIHLAWEAAPENAVQPSIKYHPETKLLVVSGSAEQIDLMNAVLGQLDVAPPSTTEEEPPVE